jgi:class 3 adenylate cyclase
MDLLAKRLWPEGELLPAGQRRLNGRRRPMRRFSLPPNSALPNRLMLRGTAAPHKLLSFQALLRIS